ncbi:hypothetical protein KJ705_00295 [Patescibacteria group bacterium]|nr:hypothetical protein [Patescibacteria group bacterium]
MKTQKQKLHFQEIGWLLLVVIVVVAISFTLGKIGNYFENKQVVTPAHASTYNSGTLKPYSAKLVSRSYDTINIDPGKRITFEAEFENTGSETWYNNLGNFVALNNTNPPGRNSDFRDIFWPNYYRPTVMKTPIVEPGETGLFRFALTAPQEEGIYAEKLGLVAEHLTWIDGGDLEITMRVGNPLPHFSAKKTAQSHNEIDIEPGNAITVWVEFENTGSQNWDPDSNHFVALNVNNPVGRESVFRHEFWPAHYRPTVMKDGLVSTGEKVRFEFALQAPDTVGSYTEDFGLVAENLTWIQGGTVEITINVAYEPEPVAEIEGEPDVRIGLYPTSSEVTLSANGDYEIRNTENTLLGSYNQGEVSTIEYENGIYSLSIQESTINSTLPLRAVPKSSETILEITNYEHRPEWDESLNDNLFRGILEISFAEAAEQLWIINELPLESYLRGVAEAGNDNDQDYLKALLTAARTYAMYHYQTGTKHADEDFTIDAIYDQVYRGYGFETRSPNVTQAILDTEGTIVTYEDELAITPYFSQSDGRTRSWEEVWAGGPYHWLVTVDDPACEDKELLGHGVGMSAYGARAMAEDGEDYESILKHYYTDIELKSIY